MWRQKGKRKTGREEKKEGEKEGGGKEGQVRDKDLLSASSWHSDVALDPSLLMNEI